jgi:hypothetical protein
VPNVLHVLVENPDELLNAGAYGAGAVVQVQSGAAAAGPFADDGSVPIVTLVRAYTYYDSDGVSSTWYRTRYENAAGTTTSDWSDVFQTGETAGLLCSLYDVKQRLFGTGTVSANEDELILEIIREVSDEIEDYVGAWLAPRPTDPLSTMTLLFDVPRATRSILLESGSRRCGIRTLTSMGLASQSQPESGGTYTAATLADVLLRPRPTDDGPAWRLELSDRSGSYFYPGYNTVQVVGSFGPETVAARIQAVALAAVTRRYMGKDTATTGVISVGPEGGVKLLGDISPSMRDTLNRLRVPAVA